MNAFARKSSLYCLLICAAALFSSCKEETKEVDSAWKIENTNALNALATNKEFQAVKDPAGYGTVYVKWLERGTGDRVYFTSKVDLYYKGMLIDRTVFDQWQIEDGQPFKAPMSSGVMDSQYKDMMIQGFLLGLEYMRVGDKCEVWMPYQLAYGETDKTDQYGEITIPKHSTLIFEIEVVDVHQY